MKRILVCFVFFISFFSCSLFGFTVSLSTQSLELGEPLGIRIVSETPLKQYKCVFLNKRYHLFLDQSVSNDYTYVAYIGASRKQVSGDYTLIISLESEDGHHFYEHYNVSVNHPEMKKGRVNLTTKSKSVAKNVDARRYEYSLLSKKFNVRTNEKYFEGSFALPTYGRVSSGFGKVRHYNNGSVSSHAGVDFANSIGTVVKAPQAGKVILSESLTIHGNTIMIDHGYGIISIYCHLNKRSISEGDFVKQDQMIGEIGDTGIVSGPHLHWGLSVQNTRVDPLYWVQDELRSIAFQSSIKY